MVNKTTGLASFFEFCRDKKVNLTAITWAHAVNTQKLLDQALSSPIDMIEADIVLGSINNSGPKIPVMAHPPATSSDISLQSFLNQTMEYNSMHKNKMKGIKLDFKSIEVFEGSVDILNEKVPQMVFPIWLNADIIRGPVNETTTVPVDPDRFFTSSTPFKKAVLSIGWTTSWGSNCAEGEYTSQEIDDMLKAIQCNNVTSTGQPITFPVRAGIAANSLEQLSRLLQTVNKSNECSLTIWSSQNDYVNVEKLRNLIFSIGFDRIYLDVPDDLAEKLNLGITKSISISLIPSLLGLSLISACMFVVSCWLQHKKN